MTIFFKTSVHLVQNGVTPLLVACEKNQLGCVLELISSGVDVHKTLEVEISVFALTLLGQDGKNALMTAAASGAIDIVEILLGTGLDVNLQDKVS